MNTSEAHNTTPVARPADIAERLAIAESSTGSELTPTERTAVLRYESEAVDIVQTLDMLTSEVGSPSAFQMPDLPATRERGRQICEHLTAWYAALDRVYSAGYRGVDPEDAPTPTPAVRQYLRWEVARYLETLNEAGGHLLSHMLSDAWPSLLHPRLPGRAYLFDKGSLLLNGPIRPQTWEDNGIG